jgi:hypothetical protein
VGAYGLVFIDSQFRSGLSFEGGRREAGSHPENLVAAFFPPPAKGRLQKKMIFAN